MKKLYKYWVLTLVICFSLNINTVEALSVRSVLKKISKILLSGGPPTLEAYAIPKEKEIIGYEPSWILRTEEELNNSADYPFNLLSTIVVGEYDVHPITGEPRSLKALQAHRKRLDLDDDKNTIIRIAKRKNPKIKALIALTYYGDFRRPRITPEVGLMKLVQGGSIKTIAKGLIKEFNVFKESGYEAGEYGVIIDFEGYDELPDIKKSLPKFIKNLKRALPQGSLIYFKLPPQTFTKSAVSADLVKALSKNNVIKYFVLKGYGFEQGIKEPVSIAPIRNGGMDIEWSVNHYSKAIGNSSRLVVEFSAYGTQWEKVNINWKPYRKKFYVPYKEIVYDEEEVIYSPDSSFRYWDTDEFRYVFDDVKSMEEKYRWANQDTLGLGGIGIATLGYLDLVPNNISIEKQDKKRSNLAWWAVAEEYGVVVQPIGWTIAAFMFLFIFVGFVFSAFRYWEVRSVTAYNRDHLQSVIIRALGALIFFLLCKDIIPRHGVGYLIVMGIFIMLYVSKMIRKYMSKVKKYAKYT